MLQVACPRCRDVLSAPDHAAGKKSNRPCCRQRLQIPPPALDQTVLAQWVPQQAGTAVPPPSPGALIPASVVSLSPAPAQGSPVPIGPTPRRRRWLALTALGLLLLGGGLGALIALNLAIPETGRVAEKPPNSDPDPAGKGDKKPPEEKAVEAKDGSADKEELVKKYILNNAKDAAVVKFIKWGPHMSGAEMRQLIRESGLDEKKGIARMVVDLLQWPMTPIVSPFPVHQLDIGAINEFLVVDMGAPVKDLKEIDFIEWSVVRAHWVDPNHKSLPNRWLTPTYCSSSRDAW